MGQLATTTDLDKYFENLKAIPKLEAEEELELAKHFEETGDINAAKRLITGNLWFVIHIAKNYSGYGLPFNDLIQEGNVGLMKAVKNFSYKKGNRLATYANYWVRAEIHEYIFRNMHIVRNVTTKPKRKLFFKLRGMKKKAEWLTREETQHIAEKLSVKPEEVTEMELSFAAPDLHLVSDDKKYIDEPGTLNLAIFDGNEKTPEQSLIAESDGQYHMHQMYEALDKLDERDKDIIVNRHLTDKPSTLHELGEKHGVSFERIRQLEKRALKEMRSYMVN